VLTVLGDARLQSYRLTRRRPELEAAIAALDDAVALDDSPREPSNLGVALSERHLATGSLDDLERAIALLTTAVEHTPPRAPDRPWRLANLGGALAERYERRGDRRDLDAAISAFDESASADRPDPDRVDWRYNLALGLRDRYTRDGYLPDLDRAVELLEQIVAVAAAPRVRADRLDQLAGTLRTRALRRGDGAELARAVELHRAAAASVPASERVMLLSNLGGTLRAWAGAGGGRTALDEAVQAYRDAVAASSSDNAVYPTVLANLGNRLVDLHDTTGETDPLNEAIAVFTAAVAATDPRSPDLPARLHNRARALQRRHVWDGDPSDGTPPRRTTEKPAGRPRARWPRSVCAAGSDGETGPPRKGCGGTRWRRSTTRSPQQTSWCAGRCAGPTARCGCGPLRRLRPRRPTRTADWASQPPRSPASSGGAPDCSPTRWPSPGSTSTPSTACDLTWPNVTGPRPTG
jgi:tetratricopeptide (TPR) repeat protein